MNSINIICSPYLVKKLRGKKSSVILSEASGRPAFPVVVGRAESKDPGSKAAARGIKVTLTSKESGEPATGDGAFPSFPSCTWERTCLRNFVAAFLAVTLLSLTACSKLTEDNLQKVHNGMTTTEVKAILGDPTSSQTGGVLGITGTTYTYHTDTSDVKITFLDDKVVTTSGDFK